jgi:predicted DNA-binding ribbon-helix-helix protein
MKFPAEQVRAGGWIAAIYKAIRYYDVDDPAFDHFEATIVSGKTAEFLSSIRALGKVDQQQYEVGDFWGYVVDSSCTIMVYTGVTMALAKRSRAKSTRLKHVRRSITLPPKIARQVEALAKERDLSDNRVLIELIEQGIEARQQKEKAFFQLAERFRAADDPEQVKQLGDQLGRFVFGE